MNNTFNFEQQFCLFIIDFVYGRFYLIKREHSVGICNIIVHTCNLIVINLSLIFIYLFIYREYLHYIDIGNQD